MLAASAQRRPKSLPLLLSSYVRSSFLPYAIHGLLIVVYGYSSSAPANTKKCTQFHALLCSDLRLFPEPLSVCEWKDVRRDNGVVIDRSIVEGLFPVSVCYIVWGTFTCTASKIG